MRRAVPLSVILVASGIAGCAHTHSAAGSLAVATTSTPRAVLYQNERTVWSDQVVWTRQYIAATGTDERSARVARNRLAMNGEAIGGMLTPYYGQTAGAGLTAMLRVQFGITAALAHADKSGDPEQKEELERRLHENSNAIARFLAGLNPYWSPTELESLLNRTFALDLSARDVVVHKDGHLDRDEMARDGSLGEARELADVIADGITHQFPYGPPDYRRQ
jgi:hypothetical protein